MSEHDTVTEATSTVAGSPDEAPTVPAATAEPAAPEGAAETDPADGGETPTSTRPTVHYNCGARNCP